MVLKYIFKNFSRRKIRTILMMLSLIVSTGLIVAMSATVETIRQSNVELIAAGAGRYDLLVSKTEISPDPFIDIERVSEQLQAADEEITAVYPRFHSLIEMNANGEQGSGWLIGLDPDEDDIGFLDVISGTYQLENNGAAVLEATASAFNLDFGDTIEVAYSFPRPREEGRASAAGSSQRSAVAQFTVNAVVRQDGVSNAGVRDGLIVHLADVQSWLGLPNRAEQLVALVSPSLYESRDAEAAALSVRRVATAVQAALGDEYQYALDKATILDHTKQVFLVLQALINTYGLMALGVVGLLVHTLVMTNVQEQKRELAILRILGSQRNYLYLLVLGEVLIIGIIGIGIGVLFGQLITQYAVIPFITRQMSESGLTARLQPTVNLTAVLPAIISAAVVLLLSTLKPAQEAARTKVMHAINPGVADNIQLEDLSQLRERRPNGKMLIIGVGLMFAVLMTIGLDIAGNFGNPAVEATIFFSALLMMVLGIGLIFFITTVPFERLIIFLMGLIAPRVTFFAKRNVSRNQARNTLISMLVLFSGVLPSFIATQNAIELANLETDVRLDNGAPINIRVFSGFHGNNQDVTQLRPSFMSDELTDIPGVDQMAGVTYAYRTAVSDKVGMRDGTINVTGIIGNLDPILYDDMVEFVAGGPDAFTQILENPTNVIISEGLSEALAVPLGGTLNVTGAGLDHHVEMSVVGVARRLPGFNDIGRIRSAALDGSTVLVSHEGFRNLITDPLLALPPEDEPVLERILATIQPDADAQAVSTEMGNRFSLKYSIFTELTEVEIEQAETNRAQGQAFLLVLTVISFTTAVFGVFAVIYVTIYARRLEIGMMKAFGSRTRELTGMLIVESIAMTLSAAMAGITAGAAMGYLFAYSDNLTQQRPMQFAIDTTVMPFIVVMVVLASILGAAFSARRIVKKRAVEILRM